MLHIASLLILLDGQVTHCLQEPCFNSSLAETQRRFDCLFTSAEEQNAGREISTHLVEVGSFWNRKMSLNTSREYRRDGKQQTVVSVWKFLHMQIIVSRNIVLEEKISYCKCFKKLLSHIFT
jgi:hypothetical protein